MGREAREAGTIAHGTIAAVCSNSRCGKECRDMYSLYWLSRAEPPLPPPPLPLHAVHAPSPLSPLTLPDVVVAVGEAVGAQHQFAAHRAVLSANSGYFKAALGHDPPPSCVAVSGVTAEALAPLLGYMYTGYLDIGSDNIYDVLLATHYLHMPRALELCWNFLRAHPPAAALEGGVAGVAAGGRATLVKPIAGLPWRPALGPAPGPPQPPASHMVLPTAEHSPFRAPFIMATSPPPARRFPEPSPSPTSSSVSLESAHSAHSAAETADATAEDKEQRVPQVPHSTSRGPRTSTGSRAERQSPDSASTPSPEGGHDQAASPGALNAAASKAATAKPATSVATGKVVIDVACCDGPVRFHRVLNASYGCTDDGAAPAAPAPDPDENLLHQRLHVPGAAQLRRSRANRMATEGAGDGSSPAAGGEFTCLYCNHTFKSHYCYQKHARRHLNPLTPKQGESSAAPVPTATATAAARAPARPLDMNVQYYPCKTCGSKFPSYYFVHKHRKLCHSGEETDAAKPAEDDVG